MTRILIVDDDVDFRTALARDMERQNLEVHVAESFDEAIEELAAADGIDILLTDLRMPDRDGLDLLQVVREASPQTSMILMSAYASARDYQTAVDLGSVEVLNKPFSRDQLKAAVSRALECRRGYHGNVHGLELVDILQVFHVGRRSASVHLGQGRTIFVAEGNIVHAEAGELSGEEALASLLAQEVGHLRTLALADDFVPTISKPFEQLILDIARVNDERSSGRAPSDDELDLSAFDEPFDSSFDAEASPPSRGGESAPVVDDALATEVGSLLSDAALDMVPRHTAVVACRPSTGAVALIRGGEQSLVCLDVLLALMKTGMEYTGSDSVGSYAHARTSVGVAVMWNLERDLMVSLIEPLESESDMGWFRLHAAALARSMEQNLKHERE